MSIRASWPLALALALVVVAADPIGAASLPPRLRFRTLETPRVRVHYHDGLEAMARQAAALSAEILERYEGQYGFRVPRVELVLSDVEDAPNGFATPLPYPLVNVRAAAPDGSEELGNHEGWLRLVLTHELAHVVHLERARGLVGLGRRVFGRAPFLFPNALSPDWLIEGLATWEETRGTAFGRGRSPLGRMVLRMAALEDAFPGEDRPVSGLDAWPAGQAAYLFGADYMGWLAERFGPDTVPELVRVHAGRPVPFLDELTARKVTGRTHHARWAEWRDARREEFGAEAARIRARGLTRSEPLTSRGVRQIAPRFSPDGAWIAYTSATLTRPREIRLVRPDGTEDRALVRRDSGQGLSWTPDGREIVFDRDDVHATFERRSDLWSVDVASGDVRRLTRGLRASAPDVSPDGSAIVFVRRFAGHSELQLLPRHGGEARHLAGGPGELWSGPRFAPDGRTVVASRWREGGWLDVVLVDVGRGDVTPLTVDRAADVEPTFTPDGTHVLFRSDRDGVPNLWAVRLSDHVLLRVTSVLGGAFDPAVGPDGRRVAFSAYSAAGYDVHVAGLDPATLGPAAGEGDPYSPPRREPAPVETASKGYATLGHLRPRFWMPYAEDGSELRLGVLTAGADPLLRHGYALAVHGGADTGRVGAQGYYLYDRLRPTLLLSFDQHFAETRLGTEREREVALGVQWPLRRRVRSTQSLSLAWQRRAEEVLEAPQVRLDLGGIELAWTLSSTDRHPFSVSPTTGWRLRAAALREDPALGSELALWKLLADARRYERVGGNGVLALRLGAGTTLGEPAFDRSFEVGGFGGTSLLDVVGTSHSVLRGYDEGIATGRRFLHANAELRLPLVHPQRGWRTLPLFVRHLHGALFFDAAHAWSRAFAVEDVRTSVGAGLGTDVVAFQGLPLTATAGVAHPLRRGGSPRAYFRLGLAY